MSRLFGVPIDSLALMLVGGLAAALTALAVLAARNRVFLAALAGLTTQPVLARSEATGTTGGAALLARGPAMLPPAPPDPEPVAPLGHDLSAYAREWEDRAAG